MCLIWFFSGGRFEKFLGDLLHMDLYGQGGTSLTMGETAWKHLGTFGQCLAIDTLIHLSVSLVHLVVNLSLTRRVKFAMRSVLVHSIEESSHSYHTQEKRKEERKGREGCDQIRQHRQKVSCFCGHIMENE